MCILPPPCTVWVGEGRAPGVLCAYTHLFSLPCEHASTSPLSRLAWALHMLLPICWFTVQVPAMYSSQCDMPPQCVPLHEAEGWVTKACSCKRDVEASSRPFTDGRASGSSNSFRFSYVSELIRHSNILITSILKANSYESRARKIHKGRYEKKVISI